ncbi:DUF3253 domain-containing protein [Fulvimarina sp. 2208YS6-2-32]|uniref:DUF3253 domain-containing protein n=1 Tax=Fulvimarina uroteuthidis TaxID=3098149 RepID=A0ABU5I2J1_9HYPH|nr:DUF3253 domain-containing protein [Fulvimarina sp. 2208YS6-2-32]MDY8109588.1 DUF3253 domain-containing protein [Fulvimarina sp. 2208YS6-2-32]
MTDAATIDRARITETIVALTATRGPGKTVCPSEVARALAGSNEKEWRKLMAPIRAESVRLASAGEIVIKRKGKPVDPQDFKGIYRLALPAGDGEPGAEEIEPGKSEPPSTA